MAVVSGSEQLAALGARLKVAGGGGLRVQLLRGIKQGADPLVGAVYYAALNQLPKRGGLNVQVAKQKVTVSVRTGARTAGVRMTTTAPDTKQTDSGYVRHPMFGDRKKWIKQEIPAAVGWWSETLQRESPKVTKDVLAVMKEVSVAIQAGL